MNEKKPDSSKEDQEDAEPPGSRSATAWREKSEAKRLPLPFSSARVARHTRRGRELVEPQVRQAVLEVSQRSRDFLRRFFRGTSLPQWNDWRWQLRNRVEDFGALARIVRPSDDERAGILRCAGGPPLAITPYYASLLDQNDSLQPLRRTVVPVSQEAFRAPGEADDPLAEDEDSPVPGLVHRYPDRVLFLATPFCATYCRYCTRSRIAGNGRRTDLGEVHWGPPISYIEETPSVRDVLLSGGDPLTLSDEKLGWLLCRLRSIRHVEILRIGTKVPVVLPQRITPSLTRMLKRFHPLWISIHFTHPDELTPEVAQACRRLADAGIPLGSQTVLLAGINDDVETMRRLVQGLLKMRVRPYYLYQCDPISGSSHFRTSVEKGLEIISGLRGHTTGYAVPTYVIDAPGGGGKIPLSPDYVWARDEDALVLRNYEGRLFRYPEPSRQNESRGKKYACASTLQRGILS